MTPRQESFRIGECEVCPSRNLVTGPLGTKRIEPKAMAVLMELVGNAGQTLSRRALLDAVWPRGFVTDDVLTRCVTQLRKALGEDPRRPRLVETVPRKGYRLLAPIRWLAAPAAVEDRAQLPGLLVLPFQNLSGSPDQDYLADGMTELLIAQLAAIHGLRVLSRTTAMSFRDRRVSIPELLREIDVAWIVEGSILLADRHIQVVAQLIDASCDAHVWADKYQRTFADLLALQNDISTQVAREIQLKVAPRDPPAVLRPRIPADALRSFLSARQFMSRRAPPALREALKHLEKVVAQAPDYAPAWGSMGEIHMLLAHYGAEPPERAVPEARSCTGRALALDAGLAGALCCQGALALFFDRDPQSAEDYLRRALEQQPSYALALVSMANVCIVRGQAAEADAWIRQALLVDPLDLGINMNVGDHLILQKRYADAAAQFRKTLELAESHVPSRLRLVWALALCGEHAKAGRQLERVKSATGETAQYWEYAALAAAARGRPEEAGRCVAELDRLARAAFVAPWARARAAAAAGDIERATGFLEQAEAGQSSSLVFLGVTPVFEELRAHPRARALLERLRLPLEVQ